MGKSNQIHTRFGSDAIQLTEGQKAWIHAEAEKFITDKYVVKISPKYKYAETFKKKKQLGWNVGLQVPEIGFSTVQNNESAQEAFKMCLAEFELHYEKQQHHSQ